MAKVIARMTKYTTRTFPCVTRENLFGFTSSKVSSSISRSIATTRCLRADKFFTDRHEWIVIDGKIGTIGISNYAQESLGDVVYAQLPEIDTEVKQGDECGALESVKAASELYSPVSGKVIEKNEVVEKTPSLVNKSCYEKGWLFKIELNNPDELKSLMNEQSYELYLKSDPH